MTWSGGLYRLKGYPDGVPNALMHVETRRIAVDVSPWIGMGTVGHFVPDRVWITDGERRVIDQRSDPRVSFAGDRHGGRWPVHIPPGWGSHTTIRSTMINKKMFMRSCGCNWVAMGRELNSAQSKSCSIYLAFRVGWMVPRGAIAQANIINTLGWLTSLTTRTEPKPHLQTLLLLFE